MLIETEKSFHEVIRETKIPKDSKRLQMVCAHNITLLCHEVK